MTSSDPSFATCLNLLVRFFLRFCSTLTSSEAFFVSTIFVSMVFESTTSEDVFRGRGGRRRTWTSNPRPTSCRSDSGLELRQISGASEDRHLKFFCKTFLLFFCVGGTICQKSKVRQSRPWRCGSVGRASFERSHSGATLLTDLRPIL